MFGKGKSDNDYGSGFYLTPYFERASEWACDFGCGMPYVNEYRLNVNGLSVLNLNDLGPLSWITEVAYNRNIVIPWSEEFMSAFYSMYKPDLECYDVIVELRADDDYVDVVTAFLDNTLGALEVQRMFEEEDLGLQYFLRSERAFNSVEFVGRVEVHRVPNAAVAEARVRSVSKIANRQKEVKMNRQFTIPYPTFSDSLQYALVWNKEGMFYERTYN